MIRFNKGELVRVDVPSSAIVVERVRKELHGQIGVYMETRRVTHRNALEAYPRVLVNGQMQVVCYLWLEKVDFNNKEDE
jgi:hypothetical protein